MVECRSNSRHMLAWLMDQLDADKDSIFLAVTKAHDQGTGMVRACQLQPGSSTMRSRALLLLRMCVCVQSCSCQRLGCVCPMFHAGEGDSYPHADKLQCSSRDQRLLHSTAPVQGRRSHIFAAGVSCRGCMFVYATAGIRC